MGGRGSFVDERVSPRVTLELSDMEGHFRNIASDPSTQTEIHLQAILERTAPLTLSGHLNPLQATTLTEAKLSLQGAPLLPLGPYSSRFLGYHLARGRVSLDLDYQVTNQRLRAHNRIIIDNLDLGRSSGSPDATRLPIKLAVALLKDSSGRITLDVPVEGDLADPRFRLGRVIAGVVINLVTRAATAPFSLLGSLFGSSERLDHCPFEAGSDTLDQTAEASLSALAKALQQRPALRLEVIGRHDPHLDAQALIARDYERRLRFSAWSLLRARQANPPPPDQLQLTEDLEAEALTLLAPPGTLGPDLKEAVLSTLRADADDLRDLAHRRARAVLSHLQEVGGIAPVRMQLGDPGESPEAPEGVPATSVLFRLQ